MLTSVMSSCSSYKGFVGITRRREVQTCVRRDGSPRLNRRSLGLFLLGSSGSLSLSPDIAFGEDDLDEETKYAGFEDVIHAYEFKYPVINPESGSEIGWVVTRASEKYSSAAPLAPDARARIVFQQLSIRDKVVCAVYVSPADKELTLKDSSDWTSKEVAYRILTDKGSSRLSSGQKIMDEADTIEDTNIVYKDEVPYYQFEVTRSGPKSSSDPNPKGRESFTHLIYSSAKRNGYLYTVAFSVPETSWASYENDLTTAVNSFTLLEPGKEYVAPEVQPWRFW